MKSKGLDLEKWNYVPNGINLKDWENKDNIPEEHKNLLEALESNHAYLYKLEEPFMKKMVKRLEKFTGFTALNYFSLNKSLLTSIIANFLTYFIVLIQFGISASPSDAIVPNSLNSTNNTSG